MLMGEEITERILAAAIEVHRELGPGLLESVYEDCLCRELAFRGIEFERQKELPVIYKGIAIDGRFRLDLLVGGSIVLELKSVERLEKVHEAQLLTYLRMSGHRIGLLLNFNVAVLRNGIRRMVL